MHRQNQLGSKLRVSFERTRLSAQHMADAYEQIVPVTKRRLATRAESAMHDDAARDRMPVGQARGQPC